MANKTTNTGKKSKGCPSKMGMGSHRTMGRAPKSPKFKHAMKRMAESDERKDNSRIKNPKSSVTDLLSD